MSKNNFKEDLERIKAFAFDVDGVLSDPKVILSPEGELLRSMNTKDGYALQYAVKRGYPIAIITGGRSESVGMRFHTLGIDDIYLGASDKVSDFKNYCRKYSLNQTEVLYMGDDLPDYEVMKMAGVACCPSDAVEEIKGVSVYISHLKGGDGCVRDIIEQVLRLHGKWMDGEAFTW
ncbi:MAG TPA: HAD-IIIA family hydrolase [Bacteroidales bacterium]|nr:HAD-IIIA family hydrolase [Bacteroidales bacterium]